jgi:two-component system phosphate regulon sensor histidine kinase PhoR
MNKLWLRIFSTFFALLAAVLLGIGLIIADIMKNTYMDMVRSQLSETADIIIKTVDKKSMLKNSNELQNYIHHYYSNHDPRITIILSNGKVLADSDRDPHKMENHSNRPEFREVVRKHHSYGESVRRSPTLGYSMIYIAKPLQMDGHTIGVVRASVTLKKIEHTLNQLWISLGLAMIITLTVSGIIGFRMAKRFTRPIEASIQVANRLIEKDYDSRVKTKASGELKQLANAINDLAISLKQQMEEIRENQQRLTGVLANMVSGVMLINPSGRITLVNRAMEKIIGASSDKLIGKLHIEAGKNFGLSQLIDRSLKEGVRIHEEVHIYYPKERILDAHIAPYVGDRDEIKGVITVLHDITEIRRLEKIRSEFVANVSHELKTPLTSLKGFAETLLDGAMYDEKTCRSFLKIIYDESDRLHRLISDILDLSKIEQQRLPLKPQPLNVTDVIYETVETVQETIHKKHLHLNLPDKKEVVIEAEKDRLQQIILNLVTNAAAYTPEGGNIDIELYDKGKEVDIVIRDTGIGISKQDLPRIFERFYRVDKARSRQSGGTGLGLAIVKHLVESHHGAIHVESEEGKGTEFTITLPKKQKNS